MDPGDAFAANMFKWDPRAAAALHHHQHHNDHHDPTPAAAEQQKGELEGRVSQPQEERGLEEVFSGYGVRYATVARMGELGFTASTLAGMRDEELDDMMAAMAHVFRWDLLVGERYGIKAAIRAERRRLDAAASLVLSSTPAALPPISAVGHLQYQHLYHHHHALDALSQEGLSEERVQQEREPAGSGGEAAVAASRRKKGKQQQRRQRRSKSTEKAKKKRPDEDYDEEGDVGDSSADSSSGGGGGGGGVAAAAVERQREHPFIVTEPGEVARAKKNGLDYLFHLYDQCREFLIRVQALAKEKGDKCPTKVTNQVFRYAKNAGANYINKPKMRHYVHCYALHCLDEDGSNELRKAFKERGENVGAWRQACYKPLVAISARHGYDIDAVFSVHPRLAIWYVPTKLRQLCHLARSNVAGAIAVSTACEALATAADVLPQPPPLY